MQGLAEVAWQMAGFDVPSLLDQENDFDLAAYDIPHNNLYHVRREVLEPWHILERKIDFQRMVSHQIKVHLVSPDEYGPSLYLAVHLGPRVWSMLGSGLVLEVGIVADL
jgi:hypothetical protein